MHTLRALLALIRAWWTIDRVRISPQEGKLLRIEPPSVLLVTGRLVRIVRKTFDQTQTGPAVVYDGESEGYPIQLLVQSPGKSAVWIEDGAARNLSAEEVVVIGGRDLSFCPSSVVSGPLRRTMDHNADAW